MEIVETFPGTFLDVISVSGYFGCIDSGDSSVSLKEPESINPVFAT